MKDVYYTGRLNDLGDELCVVECASDWGDPGWMVCEELRPKGRKPFITPKVFFETREAAVSCADDGEFYDYPAS